MIVYLNVHQYCFFGMRSFELSLSSSNLCLSWNHLFWPDSLLSLLCRLLLGPRLYGLSLLPLRFSALSSSEWSETSDTTRSGIW
jgi:hypothetical protein